MFFNTLTIIGLFFGAIGIFFVFFNTLSFIRMANFYLKLHCLYLINLYGINFILLASGIYSCDAIIFFKTILMIILNSISTLTIGHCFMRKVFLSGVNFDCKERTELDEELIKEKERQLQEEEIKRQELIELEEQRKIQEEQKKLQEEKERKRLVKEEKERKKKEEEAKYENERNDLQEKIREQKRKLKEKIDKARKNAKITRKQSEIDKTEAMIKDILDKYGLTEDMLTE